MAMEYVLLDDKIEVVEGLIVDTRVGNASIGFRNHTLPQTNGIGAVWMEVALVHFANRQNILFVEPQTKCIGTS